MIIAHTNGGNTVINWRALLDDYAASLFLFRVEISDVQDFKWVLKARNVVVVDISVY